MFKNVAQRSMEKLRGLSTRGPSISSPPKLSVQSALQASIVYLGDVELSAETRMGRDQLAVDLGAEAASKAYKSADWRRVSYVQSIAAKAPGGTLLDVGVGQGHFSNAVSKSGVFSRVAAIDIKTSPRFRKHGDYELYEMDAASMSFADGEFDTVVCMEVIEHIEDGTLEKAISELRRVARSRLLISVPFCEAEPIATYHRQRFVPARLQSMFPEASYTLLCKHPIGGFPWMLMEETWP